MDIRDNNSKEGTRCLIISGGDLTHRENIRMGPPDLVIACDRGYRHAKTLGIRPDLIVGDFDSAAREGAVLCMQQAAAGRDDADARGSFGSRAGEDREESFGSRFADDREGSFGSGAGEGSEKGPDQTSGVLTYPVEKDDTDTMLAIKEALRRGFREIEVTCFGGGRLDHLFANLQAGAFIAEAGGHAMLSSDSAFVYIEKAPCHLVLPCKAGSSLSVFSLSDTCTGVSIRGAKYEVEGASLTNTFPIGVSNEWKKQELATDGSAEMPAAEVSAEMPVAEVSAETGILAVMICRKDSESR